MNEKTWIGQTGLIVMCITATSMETNFERTVEFVEGGQVIGSGTLFTIGGKLDTTNLEDEFFKTIRKNEKSWLAEAEEEEHEKIIDSLTPEDEEKLKEEHAKNYHGLDDDMPDAYEDWLEDLSVDELKKII